MKDIELMETLERAIVEDQKALEEAQKRAKEDRLMGRAINGARLRLVNDYRKLGHLQSDLGFPTTGLEDLLRAYALHCTSSGQSVDVRAIADADLSALTRALVDDKPTFPIASTPFDLASQLGEAFRIYARDVQFSTNNQFGIALRTVQLSVQCFTHAIQNASTEHESQYAWALAHRGASLTLGYWLFNALPDQTSEVSNAFGVPDKEALFQLAKKDYEDALRRQPGYRWCRRSLAFLITLEGVDFDKARQHLDVARSDNQGLDSSLERSVAILFLNLAGQSPAQSSLRAKQSLAAAAEAMRLDPEESIAAYFAAASLTILAEKDEEDGKKNPRLLNRAKSAVECARARSMNAISQACAALIGAEILESRLRGLQEPQSKPPDGKSGCADTCDVYLDMFPKLVRPDIETRVVFNNEIERLLALPGLEPRLKQQLESFAARVVHRSPSVQ